MEITTKSFALNDFLVELLLRDNILTLKAENQTTWKLFALSLTDFEVKSRLGHICSSAQELYLTISDACVGLFPEISINITPNGELRYYSKTKVGTQHRKTQFSLQLEEKRLENLAKYEKLFLEINSKLREQEREICRLNIALQQSEKKRGEDKTFLLNTIEALNKRLEVTEKLWQDQAGANIAQGTKVNRSEGIKRQGAPGPLLQKPNNTQSMLNNLYPIGPKEIATAQTNKPFVKQNTLPNPKLFSGSSGSNSNQGGFVPSFRGSLTPAPNSSKNNFVFWGVHTDTATSPNPQALARGAQTPGNTNSRANPFFWNGIGQKVTQKSTQSPLLPKSEASSKSFFPNTDTGSLFGPNKEGKPHVQVNPLLTPPKSVDKEKSSSLLTSSPSSGKLDPERNSIMRNFSFQQEVEEKKEEEDEGLEEGNEEKTLALVLEKIEKDVQKSGENVDEIILDKISFRNFKDEIVSALEKHGKTLCFFGLNACSLKSLEKFPNLPSLKRIELMDNNIKGSDLEKLVNFKELGSLSLGGNPISHYTDLEPLTKLPNLIQLDLMGSPVSELPDYRSKVFSMFPDLEILDNLDKDGNEIDYNAITEEEEANESSAALNKEGQKSIQEQSKNEGVAIKS